MGFHITDMQLNVLFQTWQTNYHIYAPRNFSGGGAFLIQIVSVMEKLNMLTKSCSTKNLIILSRKC